MTAKVRVPTSAPERAAAAGPAAAANQWVAVGPATVARGGQSTAINGGTVTGLPRVSGRVRALAVSPDGRRVYAGTALGGVWFSGDAGAHWTPLDFYTSVMDDQNALQHSDALTVGAIGVIWGATAANDVVFVGAGEHPSLGLERSPSAQIEGVGIRFAEGPAPKVTPTPLTGAALVGAAAANPWRVESANLAGIAVNQFANDLTVAGVMWAATSLGLYRRTLPNPSATPPLPGRWMNVVTPFGDVEMSAVVITDRVAAGEAQRIYIATATGKVAWSANGTAWTEIVLPPDASVPATVEIKRVRLSVANGPAHPVIYALADGPRLWRIDVATPVLVTGLPRPWFDADPTGREPFGLAIAAHPTNDAAHQDMIAIGSQKFGFPAGRNQAGLFISKVENNGAAWRIVPGALVGGAPPEWRGDGVPPGVHALAWVTGGPKTHLWSGADGGVFRSADDGDATTFKERNTGLAAAEVISLAQASDVDAVMLAATRGNRLLRRRASEIWEVVDTGCVGSVAIDPANPLVVYAQRQGAEWRVSRDGGRTFAPLAFRSLPGVTDIATVTADKAGEDTSSAVMGKLALFNAPNDLRGTNAALGTNRVWYTDDAMQRAATHPPTGTPTSTGWVTLPTGRNPYPATGAAALAQDQLDSAVLACVWGSATRLYVMTTQCVYLFERNADGSWKAIDKLYDQRDTTTGSKSTPAARIPADLQMKSIAVRKADDGKGTLYVGATGPGDKSHLWYFDGAGNWITTGFLRDTPIYAIAPHPALNTVVYIGTRAGVFKGTGTFPNNGAPTWVWEQFSLGLPEAPCVDLAVYAPSGGATPLLRAALAGRGIWEVTLDATTHAAEVYLRAHPFDSRRVVVPSGGARNPYSRTLEQLRLDASPDVRIIRAPAADVPRPVATKPVAPTYDKFDIDAGSDPYDVWLMHAALRRAGEDIDLDAPWSPASATKRTNRTGILFPAPPAPTPEQLWNRLMAGNAMAVERDTDATDLVMRLRDEPDRWPKGTKTSCASSDSALVAVTVRSRHWRPLDGATVRVVLLKTQFGLVSGGTLSRTARESLLNVSPLPAGWAAAVSMSPPSALPAGEWSYADPAHPSRAVTGIIDPNNPQVVTFDVDLGGSAWDKPGWLLLAVVVAADFALTTTETDVATLVRTDHHVAARSVRNAHLLTEPLTKYAGMDASAHPGSAIMDVAWPSSNVFFTGMYLESPRSVITDSVTGSTHSTGTEIRRLSVDVRTLGWAVGQSISGPGILPGTTIAAIAGDGKSLTISAPATASTRGAALTVTGHAGATGDVIANTTITRLVTNVGSLGWYNGMPIGGAGIPLGTTIVNILPHATDPWLEISKAATVTDDHVPFVTIAGNITSGSKAITALSENVFDRGWRVDMSIAGAGIPNATTIHTIDATGLSLELSANATATTSGVPLTVGEIFVTNKVNAGHQRFRGLGTNGDEAWMTGWRDLHADWGMLPIYWGQQDPANLNDGPNDLGAVTGARPKPPNMALENARDLVSKAIRAGIPAPAVLYLDWEVGGAPIADGIAYCTKLFRALAAFGYRPGVYGHSKSSIAFAQSVPGFYVWSVAGLGGTFTPVVGVDELIRDAQLVVRVPNMFTDGTDPRAIARQWRFGVRYPGAGAAGSATDPVHGFPEIDTDIAIVGDPAFPERRFIASDISGGRLIVVASGAAAGIVYGIRSTAAKVVLWTPPGPSAKYEEPIDSDLPFWWNPFSPIAAVRVQPASTAPAGTPPTDMLFGLGVFKSTGSVEAHGDWRIQTARRRSGEAWRLETIPSTGVSIDPLPGVVALTRTDQSIDVVAVDDESGQLAVSRFDPLANVNKNSWSRLVVLPAPTGPVRRTNRPAAVSRDAGGADVFWVRPGSDVTSAVTAATNVAPIAITTGAAHGLATGDPVMIGGVLGNIAANGVFTITVTSPTTFTLDESRGSGARTAGGVVMPLDGRVYTSRSEAATPTQWSAPMRIGAANVRAYPFANLVAVSANANRIDVLFIGRADGSTPWLLHGAFWRNTDGWGAHATNLAAAAGIELDPLVPIGAVSRTTSTVDAFVVTVTGALYFATLDVGAGTWSALTQITGAPGIVAVEGACKLAGDGAMVVVTDRAGSAYTSSWDSVSGRYGILRATDLNA